MKALESRTLVYCIWKDACTFDQWDDISSHEKLGLCTVHSVGFIVAETEEKITLVMSIDPVNDTAFASLSIPKTWLIKVYRITVPKFVFKLIKTLGKD